MRGVGFYGTKQEETKMDYRELLKKYMENVGQNEGVYYIDAIEDMEPVEVSDDEYNELLKIANEINEETK